jgi:glucan endo-1,3-alpha-glucosidase
VIGSSRRMTFETNSRNPVSYFELPFDSVTIGPVSLTLNGRTTVGREIQAACDHGNVSAAHSR